jgi:glycine cleavage system H protein
MARIEEFEFPDDLFYDTKEHLWLRPQRALITIGIDDGGQDALGDVVYVQLTEAGRRVSRGEAIGSVEAAKMVRPLLAPVPGKLSEVNQAVVARPRIVNDDPYGEGWLFRIEVDDWGSERSHFVQGSDAVTAWIKEELASHGRT